METNERGCIYGWYEEKYREDEQGCLRLMRAAKRMVWRRDGCVAVMSSRRSIV
jgi:hypothetical protein